MLPGLSGLSGAGLLASVFWGAVGTGYVVYAKKQTSLPALFGGLIMVGASYFFIDSALYMSLLCLGAAVAVYWAARRF